jgi:low affinity Fe/Cu permease
VDEVAILATWAMTLVIQRAEHRDTQATHAKLDEILHALGDARNEVTKMDENEPEKSSNGESTCARTISRCWAPIALQSVRGMSWQENPGRLILRPGLCAG